MIKILLSRHERLQIKPDAPFILTLVKSRLAIPTGKYSTIMVQIFIFMGHTLVGFCNQFEIKDLPTFVDNRTLIKNGPIIRILFMINKR